jgi:hypothetical protein
MPEEMEKAIREMPRDDCKGRASSMAARQSSEDESVELGK